MCSKPERKSITDDALSEGFTDLFARLMSKVENNQSEKYDFSVRVCTLLANVIGIENALSDYIYNLDTLPNVRQLFGDEIEYLQFYNEMNNILSNELKQEDLAKLYDDKVTLINKLKETIFIPFLQKDMQNKEEYINLFNNLFSEFQVTCDFSEIENVIK